MVVINKDFPLVVMASTKFYRNHGNQTCGVTYTPSSIINTEPGLPQQPESATEVTRMFHNQSVTQTLSHTAVDGCNNFDTILYGILRVHHVSTTEHQSVLLIFSLRINRAVRSKLRVTKARNDVTQRQILQENPQWKQKSRIIYANNTNLLVSSVCVTHIVSNFFCSWPPMFLIICVSQF